MATLKDGLYQIRFVPSGIQAPLVGGLYATATDIGEPILAEAEGARGIQTWQVRRTLNGNGKYIITQPGFQSRVAGIDRVLMGWSLSNPSLKFPGGNILFKVDYAELELIPEGEPEGENITCSVKVPNPEGIHYATLDCEFYVSENNHTVTSQAYWSSLRTYRPHPHWQFIPVQSK